MQLSPYRVLFLAANPSNTSRLRLDHEVREVDESLRRSQYRDQFQLFQKQAVRLVDLRRALLDVKPHILHFSGHGAGKEGLVLDDDQAGYVMVESDLLANLVQLSPQIKCVVLNACHSYTQAVAIAQHIPYAVGMEREIGDQAAIQFATAFYDAIFAGETVPKAYQYGISSGKGVPAIYHTRDLAPADLETKPPATIPVLIVGKTADPNQSTFPLNLPGLLDFGVIQFGPVGPHTAGQGILHIQGQALAGFVIQNILPAVANAPGVVTPTVKPDGIKAQPRPLPVQLLPKSFPLLVGRQSEIEAATHTLPYHQPLEFYGPEGIGKTVLLRHLAHHPAIAPAFPGGIIYHRIRQYQSASDVLQVLFNTFYETEAPYKPTNGEIRQFLQQRDVLTLLDGSELTREQVDSLISELPDFTFLLTSKQRQLWGEGRSVKLDGLTTAGAVALVSREVGRSLTADEQAAVARLCKALQGHPLRLLQAAALVQEEKKDLAAIAQQFQATSDEKAHYQTLLKELKKPHLLILSLLAAMGGKALAAEMIGEMTRIPQVTQELDALVRRHLVVEETDVSELVGRKRYRLSSNFLAFLSGVAGLATWKLAVVDFFSRWVAQHPDVASLTDHAEALHQAMEWAIEAQQWPQVIHLGKSLESTFAANGQWDAWKHTLEALLQAAQVTGDPVVEAYALHQLGSRALGLNELTEAQDYLERALEIRTHLGDRSGIEATQQNLDFLRPLFLPPPSPPDDLPPPLQLDPVRPRPRWPWVLIGSGIIGAVVTGVLLTRPRPVDVQLTDFRLTSDTVQGNQVVEGQLTLSAPPPEPVTIELSYTNSNAVTVVPAVVIPAGDSQESFTLTTEPVTEETEVQITATYGDRRIPQTLTIRPGEVPPIEIKALNLEATQVVGGTPSGGTVELVQPAPTDLTLVLESSDPQIAEVPATITVAAGETFSSRFEIKTTSVSAPTPLTIRAVYNDNSAEKAFTVIPSNSPSPTAVRLGELSFDPASIAGGQSTTGVISLATAAPEDVAIQLQSDNSDVAIPAEGVITIPAGRTSTSFQINTREVGADTSVAIAALYEDQRVSSSLVVQAPQPSVPTEPPCDTSPAALSTTVAIWLQENTEAGQTVEGRIQLDDCVPADGAIAITLSSSDDYGYLVQNLTPSVTLDANNPTQYFSFSVPNDLANFPDGGTVFINFFYEGYIFDRRPVYIAAPPVEPSSPSPGDEFSPSPGDLIDYRGFSGGQSPFSDYIPPR